MFHLDEKNTTAGSTNMALREVASNSNRKQTLYETTKWKGKNRKPPVIEFFNLFIVTNRRHCVSKLLVPLKVPTPIRTYSTWRFFIIINCYINWDHVWEPSNVGESTQCVILQLYLIKWLELTKINLISIFASSTTCTCV